MEEQFIGSGDDFKAVREFFEAAESPKERLKIIIKYFAIWLTGVMFGYFWCWKALTGG